ncbi:MAG: potassium channel protein, partial [Phycisphaeraceae bacterium]|nr:potassium channel protein [Phycisphaeraceae bacterium]
LAAILPFYLPTTAMDARSLRAVRLVRVLRILKLARYSDALRTFGRVFVAQKEPLGLTVFLLMLLLVMSASFMYYAEREAQPEVFSSIPATMWWAVATLSTVGYGDTFPVTEWGRVLGSIIAFLGIGMFALPTGILGAGFIEEYQGRRESKTCPHCGKQIE